MMEEKHKREVLETELKNLQAELTHKEEDYNYCRQVAADSSLKLACVCQEYEMNQVALMKKNRNITGYANEVVKFLNAIDQAVSSEKIKSSTVNSVLKAYKGLPKVI